MIATEWETLRRAIAAKVRGAGRRGEAWIRGSGGGTEGGTWVNITARMPDRTTLRIQTVATHAKAVPAAAEQSAAEHVRAVSPNDTLILVAKKKPQMPTVNFFAAEQDLLDVLTRVEREIKLQYVASGLPPAYTVARYGKASEIPNLSVATHGSAAANTPYLVAASDAILVPRQVNLSNGISFDVYDQLANSGSATLVAGGVWGENVVLSGTFDTTHKTAEARRLVSVFAREIKRSFTKVRAFWVGPTALEALDCGARLAGAVQSPAQYDLRRT